MSGRFCCIFTLICRCIFILTILIQEIAGMSFSGIQALHFSFDDPILRDHRHMVYSIRCYILNLMVQYQWIVNVDAKIDQNLILAESKNQNILILKKSGVAIGHQAFVVLLITFFGKKKKSILFNLWKFLF